MGTSLKSHEMLHRRGMVFKGGGGVGGRSCDLTLPLTLPGQVWACVW